MSTVKLGNKGQSEAPFSLLLAISMMAMVLPIAMYLFTNFQEWECDQRLHNNMETLAREFELVSSLGGGRRIIEIDLGLYGCSSTRVDNFTITNKLSEERCIDICQDPNCRILSADYFEYDYDTGEQIPTPSQATQPVCIRIPFNIDFRTDRGCTGRIGKARLQPILTNLGVGYHKIMMEKVGDKVNVCELVDE